MNLQEMQAQIEASITAKKSINPSEISTLAETITNALKNGGKLLIAGNGGSAADAQHIAAELVGRYLKNRKALPAIALTTDTSALTAISNDFGYNTIFARQLEALATPKDVFLAISTSGNSENLIKALNHTKKTGIPSIALLGKDGGQMKSLADQNITIDHPDTPRIQESHILIAHIICDFIERTLCE